jgi:hypothetical protein
MNPCCDVIPFQLRQSFSTGIRTELILTQSNLQSLLFNLLAKASYLSTRIG